MSGGSLDYLYLKVRNAAEHVQHELPEPLGAAFAAYLIRTSDALHDAEWYMDGDIGEHQLQRIRDVLLPGEITSAVAQSAARLGAMLAELRPAPASRLRIYVSTAWDDYSRARAAQETLREQGHSITYDWTQDVERSGAKDERLAAVADLVGVLEADLVLVLTSDRRSRGMWIEMGAALAVGRHVVVVGPQVDTLFSTLATATFETDEQAFRFLEKGRLA